MARGKSARAKANLKHVSITNRGYGNRLKGQKVYYEGSYPKGLREDGAFKFGKNILELLQNKFGKKFKLVLTQKTDSVTKEGSTTVVRVSSKVLGKMNSEQLNRTRDIKFDIIGSQFAKTHPALVKNSKATKIYTSGKLSSILGKEIVAKLSAEDKVALESFIPDYLAANPGANLVKINASAQLKTLKEFSKDLRAEISKDRSESWWQKYIKSNILIIQQGYIQAINDFNVSIGNTKYPDFLLITHDNYLDVLEIKKPDTKMLAHDDSRDNYYFDRELSKAVIQTENYINQINSNGLAVKDHIEQKYNIQLRVVRPRGIVLAGSSGQLVNQKMRDDFRTLSQSQKNIVFITYDELLTRLENYIHVLESHGSSKARPRTSR